jgi:hypothetical protein
MDSVVAGITPFTKERRGSITALYCRSHPKQLVHIKSEVNGSYRHLFLTQKTAKEFRKALRAARRYDFKKLNSLENEFRCDSVHKEYIRVMIGNGCAITVLIHTPLHGDIEIHLSELGAQCLESKIKIVRKQIKGKASA